MCLQEEIVFRRIRQFYCLHRLVQDEGVVFSRNNKIGSRLLNHESKHLLLMFLTLTLLYK